jgi:hypothetical protein
MTSRVRVGIGEVHMREVPRERKRLKTTELGQLEGQLRVWRRRTGGRKKGGDNEGKEWVEGGGRAGVVRKEKPRSRSCAWKCTGREQSSREKIGMLTGRARMADRSPLAICSLLKPLMRLVRPRLGREKASFRQAGTTGTPERPTLIRSCRKTNDTSFPLETTVGPSIHPAYSTCPSGKSLLMH